MQHFPVQDAVAIVGRIILFQRANTKFISKNKTKSFKNYLQKCAFGNSFTFSYQILCLLCM